LSTHAIRPPADAPEPRTVVVGYDGSDEARAAFAVAIDRTRPSDRIVVVLAGPPAEVLARAAAVRDADEIVVGSRGLGRIRGALGSVSQELLREAARPVVVVTRDAAAVRGA